MSSQAIEFARKNLDKYIALHAEGEASADQILIAAMALLRVLDPAAVEDREYFDDLALAREDKCLAKGPNGQVCGRRYQHVSTTHRDCEITWPVIVVGSRVRAHGGQGQALEGTVTEITRESGRVEYMVDLGDVEFGFRLGELESIA